MTPENSLVVVLPRSVLFISLTVYTIATHFALSNVTFALSNFAKRGKIARPAFVCVAYFLLQIVPSMAQAPHTSSLKNALYSADLMMFCSCVTFALVSSRSALNSADNNARLLRYNIDAFLLFNLDLVARPDLLTLSFLVLIARLLAWFVFFDFLEVGFVLAAPFFLNVIFFDDAFCMFVCRH